MVTQIFSLGYLVINCYLLSKNISATLPVYQIILFIVFSMFQNFLFIFLMIKNQAIHIKKENPFQKKSKNKAKDKSYSSRVNEVNENYLSESK